MRLTVLIGAALCAVLFASQADARPLHHRPTSLQKMHISLGCSDPVMRPCGGELNFEGSVRHHRHPSVVSIYETTRPLSHGLHRVMAEGAGRAVNWTKPRAWCGWWMRKHLGVANPAGNLARWWAGFGQPAHGPHVGAIVVWARNRRHGHVGIITGRTPDGRWIVKSGNDGDRVRERPRSVAGAIAFRWPA